MNPDFDLRIPSDDLERQRFFSAESRPTEYLLTPKEFEGLSFSFLLLAQTDSTETEMSTEEAFRLVGVVREDLEESLKTKGIDPNQLFVVDRLPETDDRLLDNLLHLDISGIPEESSPEVPAEIKNHAATSPVAQITHKTEEPEINAQATAHLISDNPATFKDDVTRFAENFETELGKEIDEIKEAYPEQMVLIDQMVAAQDRTLEGLFDDGTSPAKQEHLQEMLEDVCKDAFKAALKDTDEYGDFRAGMKDLGERVLARFDQEKEEHAGSPTSRTEKDNGNFLGAKEIDMGLNTRIGSNLRVTAYAALKDIRAFRNNFDAEVELGNTRFKLALEKAISDRIFGRFNFRFKDYDNFRNFADTQTLVGLSLAGVFRNGRWTVNVGYVNDNSDSGDNDNPEGYYAGLGFVIRN